MNKEESYDKSKQALREGETCGNYCRSDIGNATTEVALSKLDNGKIEFLSSGIVPTTGIKGTEENTQGVFNSLEQALKKVSWSLKILI